MKNLWNEKQALAHKDNLLDMRVYTTQLIGSEPDLVLHGGGNTSVKITEPNLFSEDEKLLYVKGSGWDLATIEAEGFASVKLDVLAKMAKLETLSDTDMVKYQRAAMTNPSAPNPSVEAILHGLIPFTFVDHTHADAVVTISNTENGEQIIRELYGDKCLVLPYVFPGFKLAKQVYEATKELDWNDIDSIILLHHGVFTFNDDAKASYDKMIEVISTAEDYLLAQNAVQGDVKATESIDLIELVKIRKAVSDKWGTACLAKIDQSDQSSFFSQIPDVGSIATRGPITPDHILRTKRTAAILGDNPLEGIDSFSQAYVDYFNQFDDGSLTCLDTAPRWAIWKNKGILAFGRNAKEITIINDIYDHTIKAIQQGEKLGGWKALAPKDLFELEYWELEQAKLSKGSSAPSMQGKIALVTGAAGGIGKACVEQLLSEGAVVVALDINPDIESISRSNHYHGIICDLCNESELESAIHWIITTYGGLDLLVSNAGIFSKSMSIGHIEQDIWDKSMDINLSSHQRLMNLCVPFMEHGVDSAIVLMGSKNVPAPGPGAAAYSVAKAGLTQLTRVAALELGSKGIRVNVIHPNAVYDTAIWTDEVLNARAKHYGVTVAEYKANNVLKTEVTSNDVAKLTVSMLGHVFAKTTGAQVPIDGGNERVI